MATNPTPLPEEVYGIFCDQVSQDSVKRISASCSFASQNNIKTIHLIFQSTGGFVGDGICLYNIFRALPIDLVLYNCGTVSSIAALAFLGASKRKASAGAAFMLHRTTASPQSASAGVLNAFTESVALDDKRTEAIYRAHLNLSADKWQGMNNHDIWFSAEEAIKAGFVDEIGDFSPPKGTKIYAI